MGVDVVGWVPRRARCADRVGQPVPGRPAHRRRRRQHREDGRHTARRCDGLTHDKLVLLDVGASPAASRTEHGTSWRRHCVPPIPTSARSPIRSWSRRRSRPTSKAFADNLPTELHGNVAVGTNNSANFTDRSDPHNPDLSGPVPAARSGPTASIEQVERRPGSGRRRERHRERRPERRRIRQQRDAGAAVGGRISARTRDAGRRRDSAGLQRVGERVPGDVRRRQSRTPCADGWNLSKFGALTGSRARARRAAADLLPVHGDPVGQHRPGRERLGTKTP